MKIFFKITYLGLFLTVIYGEKCEKKKQCENLVVKENDPSVFVIYAAGRLGNHLMAFSAVLALGKMLNIRPFVQGDTAEYLKQYFVAENIPVFEDTFCNPDDIKKVLFDHDVDYLIERKDLHKGHIIGLWPWGYKV